MDLGRGNTIRGPDHAASCTPAEFTELVGCIRMAEESLGSSLKSCQEEEREMALVSRKSLTLRKEVRKGERITEDSLMMRRPGTGIPAARLGEVVGTVARCDLGEGTVLSWVDLE